MSAGWSLEDTSLVPSHLGGGSVKVPCHPISRQARVLTKFPQLGGCSLVCINHGMIVCMLHLSSPTQTTIRY